MAGQCFVEVKSRFNTVEAGIHIPEAAQRRVQNSGLCIAMTPYPDGRLSKVYDRQNGLIGVDAGRWNELYADMVGHQILYEASIEFMVHNGKRLAKVRLEHVLAIADGASLQDVGYADVPRCRWCPGGEGNMILTAGGYCPKCGRNAKGDRSPLAVEHHRDGTVKARLR